MELSSDAAHLSSANDTRNTDQVDPFRKIENLHVFLWLFKDMCWCFDFHTLGMIMVIPTIVAAVVITWIQRHHRVELIHNIAVSLWICANATWMTGEFYYDDHTRPFALVFFVLGIAILSVYYLTAAVKRFWHV